MANRQGDVDLHFAHSPPPQLTLWLGLASKASVGRSKLPVTYQEETAS